jgi:hypothetical protein
LFLLLFLQLSLGLAQPDGYSVVGQWPYGPSLAMEKQVIGGEVYVFYGEGTVLHIAKDDGTGTLEPIESFRMQHLVWSIAVSPDGQLIAVNDRRRVITLLDFSSPGSSFIVGRFSFQNPDLPGQLQGGRPEGMDFIDSQTLLAAVTPKGVWALDVSDPANTVVIGDYFEPGVDSVPDVAVEGDYAFVADDFDGLSVYDISDLNQITLALRDGDFDRAMDIQIENGIAYVSRLNEGVSIAAIQTEPALAVSLLGTIENDLFPTGSGAAQRALPLPNNGLAVAVNRRNNGLVVFDIADLANPVLVGNTVNAATRIVTNGYTVFVTSNGTFNNSTEGIASFDTNGGGVLGAPVELGFKQLMSRSNAVSITDDQIVITPDTGGSVLVDMNNPRRPEIQSWLHKDRRINKAVSVGSYLVSAAEFRDILIDDVSDPANPVPLMTYNIGPATIPSDLVVFDSDHVLVTTGDRVEVLQISPSGLTFRSVLTPVNAGRLSVDGTTVLGTNARTVSVFDFSDLDNPALVGTTELPEGGRPIQRGVKVGDLAYLATDTDGMQIWDISTPSAAVEVETIDIPLTTVRDVEVENDVAYLSMGASGLSLYDVSNPAMPVPIASFPVFDDAVAIDVTENIIAVADRNAGALIFTRETSDALFSDRFQSGSP